MATWYALIDCNNFYVSCERVFNPLLRNKPVAVLSNNDGCIIARSAEVKQLGIPMGAALHEYQSLIKKHNVIIYSANFSLYGDMSTRVMHILQQLLPDVEIYSIDEAFFTINSNHHADIIDYAQSIRTTIAQWTGIPTTIGIGCTKTLAKVAHKIAKKNSAYNGVFMLPESEREYYLAQIPVEDIWGIGRRIAALLNNYAINDALKFIKCDDQWIKKKTTITGLRTAWELRGISCLSLQDVQPNQSIAYTRSFRDPLLSLAQLKGIIASFAAKAAQKLREQQLQAHAIYIFIGTQRFHPEAYYFNAATSALELPTAYTPALINVAHQALESIYKPGYRYKRAGVILLDLAPANPEQLNFLASPEQSNKHKELMNTIDMINERCGAQLVQFASMQKHVRWKSPIARSSRHYTTQWNEILTIKI